MPVLLIVGALCAWLLVCVAAVALCRAAALADQSAHEPQPAFQYVALDIAA